MNCANCGESLDAGATFCGNCGAPVSVAAANTAPSASVVSGQPETMTPGPTPSGLPSGKAKAVTGTVFGGLSLAAWILWPIGLAVAATALILGLLSRHSQHRSNALVAIVLGSIGLLMSFLIALTTFIR